MGCNARQMHCRSLWQLPVATNLNLAYSQVCANKNLDCSCSGSATWRHQIGLLWERLSQLVNLGLLFFCSSPQRHTGPCTNLSTLVQDSNRFITAFASVLFIPEPIKSVFEYINRWCLAQWLWTTSLGLELFHMLTTRAGNEYLLKS